MAGFNMGFIPEKTITDEVIKRYGKINGYEDTKVERKKDEISGREKEKRRKIRDDTTRVLEEILEARHDSNVKQLARDYDGLYMEETESAFMGTILCNRRTTLRN
ncbi:hypothetical protein Syun_030705 [Stephania yunnanensis]|uniref:Uncharacterized protein n=1 Tax=Stephania yunnanensis TaxID=152371 RepID=A0AAP0DTU4_9MAGN